MTNNHTSHNYENFKPLDGNKDTNSQRVDDLTNALKGNSALRARVAEITDAFKNIPQPELRELTDEEKNLDMHYVFFSPTTYVQNAFDHNIDHDIDIYNVGGNTVASTFAINGTLESAKAFKERSNDTIYLGIGDKHGYRMNLWNKQCLNHVGFMIGKPGTRINKWLHDSEQLEHLDAGEEA